MQVNRAHAGDRRSDEHLANVERHLRTHPEPMTQAQTVEKMYALIAREPRSSITDDVIFQCHGGPDKCKPRRMTTVSSIFAISLSF